MKSRRNRTTIQKTRKVRKQKGGGVLSKPLRQKQNVNLSEYLSAQPIESLPAKIKWRIILQKRKLKCEQKN